jgi:hypothetical protein
MLGWSWGEVGAGHAYTEARDSTRGEPTAKIGGSQSEAGGNGNCAATWCEVQMTGLTGGFRTRVGTLHGKSRDEPEL